MISIALRRLRCGRSPWGAWTPAGLVALCTTGALIFWSLVPHAVDLERYWLAWLGGQILVHHAVPHALGAESPLDAGRPWIAQEWGYAVLVEATRRSGLYPVFAIANALAFSSLLWFSLGLAIRRRISPGITSIIILLGAYALDTKFELRAESLAVALFVAELWILDRRKGYFWLPALFLVWANLHASFPLGLMVLSIYALQTPRIWIYVVSCALLTLCNPNGIHLWEYVATLHSLPVIKQIEEWAPLWPAGLPLLLPIISVVYFWRTGIRAGSTIYIALWLLFVGLMAAALRFMIFGYTLGLVYGMLPANVRTFRQKSLDALLSPVATAAIALLLAISFSNTLFATIQHGYARDPDFGLLIEKQSPIYALDRWDVADRLTDCDNAAICSLVLFHGGRTLIDARTDPFSNHTVRLVTTEPPAWIMRHLPVTQALLDGNDPTLVGWRQVDQFGKLRLFQRTLSFGSGIRYAHLNGRP